MSERDRDEGRAEDRPFDPGLLDLVPVPAPPVGFAEQAVAAAAMEAPARRRRAVRRAMLAGAALAACAAGALFWLTTRNDRFTERREEQALERTTWSIGDRAVAVGEAGARLSWDSQSDGSAAVVQSGGDVFYRVNPGQGRFEVETPAGAVVVTGTCFRVEVIPMKEKNVWLAGGAGALAAAAVVVGVYEGRVRFGNARGTLDVGAGETAFAAASGERPQLVDREALAAVKGGGGPSTSSSRAAGAGIVLTPAEAEAQRRELEILRARVRTLEAAAADAPAGKAHPGRAEDNYIDPSKEELLERARRCGLAWDAPGLDPNFKELGQRSAENQGLNEDERQIVSEARRALNQKSLAEMRRLYVEVTGSRSAAEILSPTALQSEIVAKSPEGEVQEVFKRLAEERAGLAPVSVAPSASPLERMMRLLTGLGDKLEQDIAAQLGPARAREIRAKNKGWESKSGSSHGCPRAP